MTLTCIPGASSGETLGFVGAAYPSFLPELATRPELGWRLAVASWGSGYATEAALRHAMTPSPASGSTS